MYVSVGYNGGVLQPACPLPYLSHTLRVMPTNPCRITIVFLLVCLLCAPLPAQSGVLELPQLADSFRSPSHEFRPLIITHSMPLRRDDAAQWLEQRHAGGAVIDVGVTPGSKDVDGQPVNNPTYLNDPAQFDKLRQAMKRMKQKGQRIWLYDELGYPSGSAGGRVLEGHPEFQVVVAGCHTTTVEPGATVEIQRHEGTVITCAALPPARRSTRFALFPQSD